MREEKNNTLMILANKALDSIDVHFNLDGWPAATAISIISFSVCGCIVLVKNGYPSFQKPIKYTLQNY